MSWPEAVVEIVSLAAHSSTNTVTITDQELTVLNWMNT